MVIGKYTRMHSIHYPLRAIHQAVKELFPVRTLGAAREDTTTSSSHIGDTVPDRPRASAQVTPASDVDSPGGTDVSFLWPQH